MSSKVLYITHRVPWPPDRGDRIRTWNILRFLAARSRVDLLCLSDEPVSKETLETLKRVTHRLAIVPHRGMARYVNGLKSVACGHSITEGMFWSKPASEVLRRWSAESPWNAAIASSSGVAQYLAPIHVGHIRKRWVDLIDVDSEKWLDYSVSSGFPRSAVFRLEGNRLRKTERELASSMDRLLVVSEAERQLFRSFCDTSVIQSVENGVDTEFFSPGPGPGSSLTQPPTCAFVGVMNYLPNVDAVCWFAHEVWPRIRERFANARFVIVGKSPAPEVEALASIPGIEVTGGVSDVRPWLYQSHCAVVPLRIARGIQNKVLEAMACGKPVICSSAPLKGLQAEPGLHLLKADSPEEWVDTLSSVFQDPNLQNELGAAASAWVQMNHCWDACLDSVNDLLRGDPVTNAPEQEVKA